MVGTAGFEPATTWFQTKYADQAALRPGEKAPSFRLPPGRGRPVLRAPLRNRTASSSLQGTSLPMQVRRELLSQRCWTPVADNAGVQSQRSARSTADPWSHCAESNCGPLPYQGSALPAELQRRGSGTRARTWNKSFKDSRVAITPLPKDVGSARLLGDAAPPRHRYPLRGATGI